MKSHAIDERRQLLVPGDKEATLAYATQHWVECAKEAIQKRGAFFVALSGGSTPKEIFRRLASEHQESLDWSRVFLFWSDERSVPPTDSDSNFHMAMVAAGLEKLPLDPSHIFRMEGENEVQESANRYSLLIQNTVSEGIFDLIMLGMGDDAHTASLFPHTQALHEKEKWVVANHVPQKETWRITFTYPLINRARCIVLYVLGAGKAAPLAAVLQPKANFEELPSFNVGTPQNRATWLCDSAASASLGTDA